MKTAALIGGGLVAAVALAALVVPALIDWNRYKPDIVAGAEAALGRKVDFTSLTVRVLPAVAVTAERVSVANLPGGEAPAFATAEAVRVRLKLLPLLTGRVAIDSLVVEKPDVQLERLADGRGNWEFTPTAKAGGDSGPASPPTAKPAAGRALALNGVVIRNGAAAFRSPGKPATVIDGIAAEFDLASREGPFAGRGELRWQGQRITFDGALDRLGGDGAAPLRAALALPSADARLEFTGLLGEASAGRDLRGELTLTVPSLPLSAAATLSVSGEEAALQDIRARVGDATATGSVVAALGASPVQADAVLKLGTLDLDRLFATRPTANKPAAPPAAPPQSQTPPQAAPPAAPGSFALPTGVAAHLELSAEAITWQGSTARRVTVDAMLDDGRLSLSRATASLPGSTTVALSGVLAAEQGHPAFDGRLQATADDLRGLLGWLKLDLGAVPDSRLKRAALTGKVGLAGDAVRLSSGDLTVDDQRLRAAAAFRPGGPWSATLSSDRLDLAPYLTGGSRKAVERLGPLAVTATLDTGAINAKLVSGGVELTGEGRISPTIDLALAARSDSFAKAARLFAEGYRPKGGGPFAASARVRGDTAALDIADLSAKAGAATLGGHVTLGLGATTVITADLTGGVLDLTPFLPAERTGLMLPLPGPHGPGGKVPAPPDRALPAAARAGAEHWSREPLDLGGLRSLDARINLTAQSLALDGWRIDAPVALLTAVNGTAALETLTGKLLGGALTASARLATTGFAGRFTIVGADIKEAKLGAGGIQVTQGRLDADAKWTGAGRSPFDLVSTLNGDGRLAVRDGLITGFDLPAVNQRLNNIENLGSLLGLVQSGLSGGTTRFSALNGTFRADNGVVSSRDLKLAAEGGTATAETTIDLPRYTQDTRIAFRLAEGSAPPLGLRLEGPLDSPRKVVDINQLQRWLVERGLGKGLSGKGGGLMESLLGRKPKEAAPQDQEPPKKEKPADVLRGILKGLR
jgi:uncharacterized protein involved in outer membrane biogenesis